LRLFIAAYIQKSDLILIDVFVQV